MASFKQTNIKIFTRPGPKFTPDNIYWKKYSAPVLVKEFGPIDYIDFSPVEPYYFAVSCSARVQVYNPITKLVTKNLSSFKEVAYGGVFRRDGKLLCAGGAEAVIRLFDVSTRSLLRLFSGHKAPVHRVSFTADNFNIVSFSDDKTVALWDIPSEKQILSFNEHDDYIRAGATSPVSSDITISGGYDKYIRMYDMRTNQKVLSVCHEAPVESVLFLPSGGIFLSAGGTEIKVWDALAGGRLLGKITQHHKTVTCLKIASNGRRILSGSLDRHVKIYDSATYETLHTLDYTNAILSIGISVNDETIVAGMVDGLISVRRREEDAKDVKVQQKRTHKQHESAIPHTDIVHEEVSQIMSKHDIYLRKFQYTKALDSVMISYIVNKTPHVTIAIMQELIRRQGLKQALAGRDGKSLINILKFIIKYIGIPQFARVLCHVSNILMDVYEDNLDVLGAESRAMFDMLANRVHEEEQFVIKLTELRGILQMLRGVGTSTPVQVKNIPHLKPSNAAEADLILNIP